MRRRTRAHGFTLIEIMVSLAVAIIGLLGVMGLQATTMKGNRISRSIDRAQVCAAQMMEDLRSKSFTSTSSTWPTSPSETLPATSDGVVYTRTYDQHGVTGANNLVLLTVVCSFVDDSDNATHSATLQLVRTNQENL